MGDGEALIREVWRRWNEGDRVYNPELLDPEIRIYSALTGEVFAGEEGVGRWVAEIDDQFEEWELSIDDLEEISSEKFVARGFVRARGRHSGLVLDEPVTWRVDLRGGRLLQVENLMGPDRG